MPTRQIEDTAMKRSIFKKLAMQSVAAPYRFQSLLLATVGTTLAVTFSSIDVAKAQSAPIDEGAYADRVVDYQQGGSNDWNAFFGDANRQDERWQVYDPEAALGSANWTSEMTQDGSLGQWDNSIGTSLGREGSLTVEFTDNALIGSGNSDSDLWIFEIGGIAEEMLVEISTDNVTWYEVGIADRQNAAYDFGVGIDIDSFLSQENIAPDTVFSFVRVTDTGNNTYNNFKAGADIDAIAALSSVPQSVPEPSSIIALMTLGVVGIPALKRKR